MNMYKKIEKKVYDGKERMTKEMGKKNFVKSEKNEREIKLSQKKWKSSKGKQRNNGQKNELGDWNKKR